MTTLAIFTYDLGASFIDRHVSDLMPGKTVAVGTYGAIPALANLWRASCPVFEIDRWSKSIPVRVARRFSIAERRLTHAAVKRFLRRHRVSVVLGEYLDQFLDFVPIMNDLNLPYVVQGHGIDVSAALRRDGMREKYLTYATARAVLTRSQFHRNRLIDLGLSPDRVHVNVGGVDVPPALPDRARGSEKRFLAIGVMVPKKGPIYLLEAFRLAAQRDPEIRLDFIGGGPLLPAARQFVEACGLASRVHLHGIAAEDTKQRLLRECGVFVQHSLTNPETGDEEGLPAAIQEAMAHGLCVVSTRHAGIPEAVIDGETGLLVDEGDAQSMAEAFLGVEATADEMGRRGYERAKELYRWEDEKGRLIRFLGVPA